MTLFACSSAHNAVVYYNFFDFDHVKNYSFYPADSLFSENQNLNYAQRNRIEFAIEKNMVELSLNYTELSQADIIVTYYIVSKDRHDYRAYNEVVRFCTHCLNSDLWIKKSKDWQPYPGGLIIDLINPKNGRSVWRSIYPLNVDEKDNSNELNNKIMEAVASMMKQYPN